MLWLTLGVLSWSLVHLSRCLVPDWRRYAISKVGENTYKGLFALCILVSVALMVIGWRSSLPIGLYVPARGMSHLAALLLLVAFILMAASSLPTNIKRFVRHPQLSAVILWAVAHLMANGDQRALIQFGVIGLWAVVEILLINRRDGRWNKSGRVAIKWDVICVMAGTALYLIFVMFLHQWLFAVRPF